MSQQLQMVQPEQARLPRTVDGLPVVCQQRRDAVNRCESQWSQVLRPNQDAARFQNSETPFLKGV